MSKKTKGPRRRSLIVYQHGRHRFQRGMVTAAFLQHGLSLDDAQRLSGIVKARVEEEDEIDVEELMAMIHEVRVEHGGGIELPTSKRDPGGVLVSGPVGVWPFSRGVLVRRLATAGLEIGAAFDASEAIEVWLRGLGDRVVEEARIDAEVARRLRETHGASFARRFELVGWIRRSTKPVIVLIGGATGTGKSTLATEMASRLGISSVTGTDLIRETMRTVLSAEVVPGLHDHSFRAMGDRGQIVSNPRKRVLLGFHEQVAQVGVGVRAVIRRALRERTHLIVEGTHLVPPFAAYLPPGADAHVVGFVLAVGDEEEHRARFPRRAGLQVGRPSEPYLEAFQAVRWIHDELVAQADEADATVLTNESLESTVTNVASFLAEALPVDGVVRGAHHARADVVPAPTLMVILDGLGDEPNRALGGKTPLAAARTPTMGMLAASGALGQVRTGREGKIPGTDDGLLALLAGGDVARTGVRRGLMEALGAGVPLPPEGVLLRGNLATVQSDGLLVDRRAGRIREGVADLVADLRDVPLTGGVWGDVYPGHEHRVVVVLRGPGLSDQITDTDPGGEAAVQRILPSRPLVARADAERTALALAELLVIAQERLAAHPLNEARRAGGKFPANCVITRGATDVARLPKRESSVGRAAMVSGCGTALGVARLLGFTPATAPSMTGNLDTDLDVKFSTAMTLLADHALVVVHVKGTDVAAHDRMPLEKADFIEDVDAALGRALEGHAGLRVVITADHGTSSRSGNHLADPVPLLVSTWSGGGEATAFDEEAAANGVLGLLTPGELAEVLLTPTESVPRAGQP